MGSYVARKRVERYTYSGPYDSEQHATQDWWDIISEEEGKVITSILWSERTALWLCDYLNENDDIQTQIKELIPLRAQARENATHYRQMLADSEKTLHEVSTLLKLFKEIDQKRKREQVLEESQKGLDALLKEED